MLRGGPRTGAARLLRCSASSDREISGQERAVQAAAGRFAVVASLAFAGVALAAGGGGAQTQSAEFGPTGDLARTTLTGRSSAPVRPEVAARRTSRGATSRSLLRAAAVVLGRSATTCSP
jgi:hypothetical protein